MEIAFIPIHIFFLLAFHLSQYLSNIGKHESAFHAAHRKGKHKYRVRKTIWTWAVFETSKEDTTRANWTDDAIILRGNLLKCL